MSVAPCRAPSSFAPVRAQVPAARPGRLLVEPPAATQLPGSTMEPRKQKPLSSLYGDPTAPMKKKLGARGRSSSDDNPSIASLLRHPPPLSRLPAHIAAAGRAAGHTESSTTPAPVEEDMDEEVEDQEVGDEDKEDLYVPDDNGYEDEENSYDNNDDMSEEDVHGIPRTDEVEPPSIEISSGEDGGRVKGKNKRKKESSGAENSKAWKYFEKVYVVDENNPEGPQLLKARCLHCTKEYAYVQGSSTSTLNRQLNGKCKKLNAKIASQLIQSRLSFKPINANIPGSTTHGAHGHVRFEQAIVKELIAKMVMVHEYSFRMVEHEWFNIVLKYLNPLYQPMGRKAIRAECTRVYKREKEKLKVALQDVDYISLTTDLWTSNQTIAYMCVVAHYIDEEWKMQTRVLAFMELDPPHSGHVIADAVWDCVNEWKIENKVISITLDNASNNDVVVKDLKAKFTFRRCKQFEEPYFHVRCCAHIVNLVVQDGTSCMANLITNLRETVKYFKKSTGRLHKFVEICRGLDLTIGAHLTLDVCTRWSSTYKMIATGLPYKEALKDYAKSDLNYKWEPSSDEWKLYQLISPMLFAFAQVTTAFSAQSYPTANIFYRHIVSIKIALTKAMNHNDATYRAMGEAMVDKFNKYWEEKNNVMVLTTILDPRYKMFYIEWAFKQLYDEHLAIDEAVDVRVELEELFDKFDTAKKEAEKSAPISSNDCITCSSMPASDSAFQAHRRNTTTTSSKSELRNYLEDVLEDPDPKFILLDWWKVNSLRYPVLAKMAKWFLTIPTSSVSSESTFSSGGRVLDDYRSSLKPTMVEALVCGASYIKGSHSDLNVMEKEDDEEENVESIKLPREVG